MKDGKGDKHERSYELYKAMVETITDHQDMTRDPTNDDGWILWNAIAMLVGDILSVDPDDKGALSGMQNLALLSFKFRRAAIESKSTKQ